MPDLTISDLTAATPAGNDYVEILDVSDTAMSADGSNRKALVSALPFDAAGTASAAVATHVAASDPHPQYTTAAELSAALAGYQPLDSDLTAIAALSTTTFGRSLLALADAAAGRTALGLGAAALASGFDLLSPLTTAEVAVAGAAALTGTAFGRLHVCSGTSADYTVTLPGPTGNAGKLIGVRMAAGLTRLVTIDAGSGALIDGQQTRVMWAQESALLLCDGANWTKVAGRTRPHVVKLQRQGADQNVSSATYAPAQLNTLVEGDAAMWDAINGRATIPRAGVYTAVGFSYLLTGTQLAVGVGLNAAENNSATNNGYGLAASPQSGVAFLNSYLNAAAGDYIALWYYAFSAGTVLGSSAGSYPQLVVTEVPQW